MNTITKRLSVLMCCALGLGTVTSMVFAENNSVETKVKKHKQIKAVEAISVDAPVGTVPRLPYRVWVTYSDGSHEWRQVVWSNSLLATELQQSNPEVYPVGKEYAVTGFVIGDNSTDKGYQISADVKVVNGVWDVPSSRTIATPLPLGDVVLIGKNRLTNNRDLDIKTLLALDVSQQLYNYRDTYGLPTEGYTKSDGWDSPTTKLKGHGSGHYMSALAFAYASTSDKGLRAQLFERIERMVKELRECQERTFVWDSTLNRYFEARDYAPEDILKDMKGTWAAFDEYKNDYKHYGYGYLNAIPAAHPALIECYRAYNNEDWVWAPYYTIHKQLAGLIDIANVMKAFDDSRSKAVGDKAYVIARDMGLWVWNRLHYRTYVKSDGNRAERQAKPGNRYEMWNMYIAGEVGGMAESLARLSEMTDSKDEKARLLEAASYFDAPAFFDPVAKNVDDVRTRHANQHIPMITGALRSYLGNGNPYYYNLAYNFWNMVQGRYAYATGGVGNGEMFRQPYSQILSMNTSVQSDWEHNMFPNPDINETCCAYNLAKLTKDLNCFDPDNAEYMDYYERVLYNQIVGSVNPHRWGVCYQYAVGMNARKPFGSETPQSTCCGGTGVENHVKYQEAAYFVNDNTMWVGLYIPSEVRWSVKGVKLVQECEWPAENSKIKITDGTGRFSMKLRVPYWATEGFDVKLNGKSIAKMYNPSSYIEIPEREWSKGDIVEVVMPFTKHIFWGQDKMALAATGKNETRTPFNPQWVGTIMYGPLVMATSDVKEWKDADFNISYDLSEVGVVENAGDDNTNGKLYALSLGDKSFTPDYYHTGHSTHYLRLNVQGDAKKKVSKKIDKSALVQVLAVARERRDEQEAWNAMNNKVPAYAPWAPFGYARLLAQMGEAEKVNALPEKGMKQEEVDAAVSALNVAVNTMRPGNLAEPENLSELLPLLTETKAISSKTTELREAIAYADMVVQYVNDGSGTMDLIVKATKRIKDTLKAMNAAK